MQPNLSMLGAAYAFIYFFFSSLGKGVNLLGAVQMLEKLLNRAHLTERTAPPYPLVGVGYEVVQHAEGSGEEFSDFLMLTLY